MEEQFEGEMSVRYSELMETMQGPWQQPRQTTPGDKGTRMAQKKNNSQIELVFLLVCN